MQHLNFNPSWDWKPPEKMLEGLNFKSFLGEHNPSPSPPPPRNSVFASSIISPIKQKKPYSYYRRVREPIQLYLTSVHVRTCVCICLSNMSVYLTMYLFILLIYVGTGTIK